MIYRNVTDHNALSRF